jgi:hypothetical protein
MVRCLLWTLQVPLLAGLPQDQLSKLAEKLQPMTIKQGVKIISQVCGMPGCESLNAIDSVTEASTCHTSSKASGGLVIMGIT